MSEFERGRAALEREEKVLIITRRLFSTDARRHFIGMVERYDSSLLRVRGYAFVYDIEKGGFIKRKTQRTRIFPLDSHLVILVLPDESDLNAIRYESPPGRGLTVTDGKQFQLDLNEFSA